MFIHEEVRDAVAHGEPVVALESTVIAHGLPRPRNARVARDVEAAVRECGAVPATIAVIDGVVTVGLDDAALDRVANDDSVTKASVRDLPGVLAAGRSAATTVAATAHIAAGAGIGFFATGGLGGVHRGANETFDESADLAVLARTPIVVVCAGVKSILDVGATLERLESMSVPVVSVGTDRFPGFYLADSGFGSPGSVDGPEEVARMSMARSALGMTQAIVVAQPVAPELQMDRALHDRLLADGTAAADAEGVHGKHVTPYLLGWFHAHSGGVSEAVNVALLESNARFAARVAAAHAGARG
ncbi:MAG: pseudouridine-5'-phosphate glycosidase [Thermoleophilia bacterium]|nr:pseudouridine-5'-phosphate glycosidase [Thermoleophilia bacterium]